jgi:hypothetical protein
MSTTLGEVVCNEHGISGIGKYYGDKNAHLGRINVFYYKARRRVATAIDSNSQKLHHRED